MGAQHLVLISRSGPKSKAGFDLVKELKDGGINIATPKCDVSSIEALSEVLSQLQMPPIKGCLQCTMVLRVRPRLIWKKFISG